MTTTDITLPDGSLTEAGASLHAKLAQSALSADQLAFLGLHVHHNVEQWQWYWSDTLLRARTDRDKRASLPRLGVEQLVAWGLMGVGAGHSMYATAAGRASLVGEGAA